MANNTEDRTRVDKWLWAARFFKTRSVAADAVDSGRVLVNGARIKPARAQKVGDQLHVRTASGEFTVLVQALDARRGSPADAARLFSETEDSRLRREQAKLLRAQRHPEAQARGRPTKRARRMIHRLRDDLV